MAAEQAHAGKRWRRYVVPGVGKNRTACEVYSAVAIDLLGNSLLDYHLAERVPLK